MVGGFLKREEEQLRLWDPAPLPLRFRAVSAELAAALQHRSGPSDRIVRVLPLDQPLKVLAAAYEGKEPGRLLVLGTAGSGKTVLIRRFAMDRLKARGPYGRDPVPVIFSLGSWDPHKTSLRNWLIGKLERDYPFLAGDGPGGRSWADTLVMTECVLAILDGFDEIADGLHEKALRDLSAVTLPVLLTSRRPEIEAAAKSCVSFDGIELTDLTLDDVAGLSAARGRCGPWHGSARHRHGRVGVRTEPAAAPSGRTGVRPSHRGADHPLMVELARAVHRSGRDPARLLTGREPDTRETLEDHLLDRFVPAAYARFLSARSDGKRRTWPAERSRHWLGYLATHLRQLDTHDIEWWRLGTAMSLSSRMVASGAVTGFVSGVLTVLPSGFLISWHVIIVTFLNMLGSGLAFGFLQGLMSSTAAGGGFQPSRMRIRIRGGSKRVKQNLLPRIRSGLAGGLVFGVVYGLGNAVYVAVAGFPWLNVFLVFMDWFLVGLGVGLGTGLSRPRAHDRGRGGHRDENLGQPGGSAEDEPDDRAHSDPCDGPDSRYRVRRRRHSDQWIRHRGRAWNHDGSHGRPRILHLDRMGPVDRPGPSVAAPDRAAPVGGERLSRRRLPTGGAASGGRGPPVPPRTAPGPHGRGPRTARTRT